MDLQTQVRVRDIVESKARQFVKWYEVAAILEIESGGISTFELTDGVFFRNLADAAIILSPMPKPAIQQAFTIKEGPLTGKVCKFRVEPSFALRMMKLAPNAPGELKALLSASVGIGQQWTAGIGGAINADDELSIANLRAFMASITAQVEHCAQLLDKLIGMSPTKRALAYSRYNDGAGSSAVTSYGNKAVNWAKVFQKAVLPAPAVSLPVQSAPPASVSSPSALLAAPE